jgi:hypothetical protein
MSDKKKRALPMTIFVGPTGNGKQKVEHERCLLEVIEHYKDGKPRMLELMRLDDEIDVSENRIFISAYIPKTQLEREDNER